jgi:hypothetical protein
MQFPAAQDLRQQLMQELLKARRPQKISLQLKAGTAGE